MNPIQHRTPNETTNKTHPPKNTIKANPIETQLPTYHPAKPTTNLACDNTPPDPGEHRLHHLNPNPESSPESNARNKPRSDNDPITKTHIMT